MKKVLEHIFFEDAYFFQAFEVKQPSFELNYHFHEAYELTFINKGNGKRVIGNEVATFSDGDFVLINSTVPHTWISDNQPQEEWVEAYVIQIDKKGLKKSFETIVYVQQILQLLEQMPSAIVFHCDNYTNIASLFKECIVSRGLSQLIRLLQIFDYLFQIKNKTTIHSVVNFYQLNKVQSTTLQNILNHLLKHYKNKISISEIANIANLTPTATCRFFKQKTNKTIIQYVNELRIQFATQQLIETNQTVSFIASDAGFESMAFFHKVFKEVTGKTPGEYRKQPLN